MKFFTATAAAVSMLASFSVASPIIPRQVRETDWVATNIWRAAEGAETAARSVDLAMAKRQVRETDWVATNIWRAAGEAEAEAAKVKAKE